jgi:hypothetical protein
MARERKDSPKRIVSRVPRVPSAAAEDFGKHNPSLPLAQDYFPSAHNEDRESHERIVAGAQLRPHPRINLSATCPICTFPCLPFK